jgi:drug/metabolite transporter, DME family
MLIGVLASLGSAALWAVTNMLVKLAAPRLGVVAHSAYRASLGSVVMIALFLLLHDPRSIAQISPAAMLALISSVVIGMAFGDTLNFRSMLLIGLARSMPISGAFPLFTMLMAAAFLNEAIGVREVLGCLVTLVGVMLVALPPKAVVGPPLDRRTNLIGVGLALAAALLWAAATSILKVGLTGVDVVTAGAVRLPFAALALWLMLRREPPQPWPWQLRGRTLAAVLTTGLVGSVLGSYLALLGVQEIGAARSAILSSTSPIFAAPLSLLFLGEKMTGRVLAGTLLSIVGIVLIVA